MGESGNVRAYSHCRNGPYGTKDQTIEFESVSMRFVKTEASSQLLATCLQFYDEGMPLLYGENTFSLHYSEVG